MTNHLKERIERKEKLGELNKVLSGVITHSLKMMGNGELEKYKRFHKECLTKRGWCDEHEITDDADSHLTTIAAYTHYAGSK